MAVAESKFGGFSLQLYKTIGSGDKNVFFSPHSVSSALMLVCLGAKKGTFEQITNALGLKGEVDIHETFRKLNDRILQGVKDDGNEIRIANKLYTRTDLKVLETYAKLMADFYGGAVEPVDFAADPDGCRISINKWVEEQTNGKIKDLLAPGLVTPNTKMVMTNAIYFKGLWEKPFKTENTKEMDFNVTQDEKVKVQMMIADIKLPHVTMDDLSLSAVAIPYKGNSLSMIILLPNTINGMTDMERSLTSEKLQEILNILLAGRRYGIDIMLPRFKMAETCLLTSELAKIGITDLFDQSKVDLSGMFETEGSSITDVIHKAFIEVNEEGTEAAAATAMMSRMMLFPVENTDFRCDRPFMFCLVENSTKCILFMGKLFRPE